MTSETQLSPGPSCCTDGSILLARTVSSRARVESARRPRGSNFRRIATGYGAMYDNSWPADAVCLHAWNSLARDGEVRDALAYAQATKRQYVHHACQVGEMLNEHDLKHMQERYFYHKQVFVVGRKVLLSAFDRKEYFRFKDKSYAHQNMKATVIEIAAGDAIKMECEGRPSHDNELTLPKEQMAVYSLDSPLTGGPGGVQSLSPNRPYLGIIT